MNILRTSSKLPPNLHPTFPTIHLTSTENWVDRSPAAAHLFQHWLSFTKHSLINIPHPYEHLPNLYLTSSPNNHQTFSEISPDYNRTSTKPVQSTRRPLRTLQKIHQNVPGSPASTQHSLKVSPNQPKYSTNCQNIPHSLCVFITVYFLFLNSFRLD